MALADVDIACATILEGLAPIAIEEVSLARANGRVLAADLAARRTQPPFAAAAMDGWAIRAADATAPGARLAIVGEAAAGHALGRPLGPGEAARIFTGAPVPEGADTVVMQENARRDGDTVIFDTVPEAGRHIRPRGIDFTEGAVGLKAGKRLSYADLGLAAAMDHAILPVFRRPRVAFLATGDELVAPGEPHDGDRIVASNGAAIAALIETFGGEPIDLGIARDDLGEIRARVRAAFESGVDVLATLGGASVGDHDHVHPALEAEGVAFDFWKIAMRPGKPLMAGRRGATVVLGLPGNPAASLVCGLIFLVPVIRRLAGELDTRPPIDHLPVAESLPANDQRRDHLRAHIDRDGDGRRIVRPFPSQDSSLLSPFAAADALILRPANAPAAAAGDVVPVMRLR